jgi:DNA-binding IclR family transcriptional regulator
MWPNPRAPIRANPLSCGTVPPGDIANIIVNTGAQGRSVVFVAEKRAALEVVQRCLRQAERPEWCLDLFSARTSKVAVLEQLNRARQGREAFDANDWHAANAAVAAPRAKFNGRAQCWRAIAMA